MHPDVALKGLGSWRTAAWGAAVFSTGGNLGFAIGPVIGGLLVLELGLHATLGLLLPAVLLVLIILFYPGDFLKREAPGRTESQTGLHQEAYPIPWLSLIAICLIVTLRAWVYMSFLTYLPMFFQNQGINPKVGSMMLAVFLVGGAAGGLYGGIFQTE